MSRTLAVAALLVCLAAPFAEAKERSTTRAQIDYPGFTQMTAEVDAYPARAYRRFAVRPGITGLWQVSGRSLTTFAEMIDLDTSYVERRSFWLNVKILVLTVPTVLHGKGAE